LMREFWRLVMISGAGGTSVSITEKEDWEASLFLNCERLLN